MKIKAEHESRVSHLLPALPHSLSRSTLDVNAVSNISTNAAGLPRRAPSLDDCPEAVGQGSELPVSTVAILSPMMTGELSTLTYL